MLDKMLDSTLLESISYICKLRMETVKHLTILHKPPQKVNAPSNRHFMVWSPLIPLDKSLDSSGRVAWLTVLEKETLSRARCWLVERIQVPRNVVLTFPSALTQCDAGSLFVPHKWSHCIQLNWLWDTKMIIGKFCNYWKVFNFLNNNQNPLWWFE